MIAKRAPSEAIIRPRRKGEPPQVVPVKFHDTLLFTPGKAGLDTLAAMMGRSKLELPPGYSKDRMDKFLDERPEEFEAYAVADADLVLDAGLSFLGLADELGLPKLPTTLASFCSPLLFNHARAVDLDINAALGVEIQKSKIYHEATGRFRTVKERVPVYARQIIEEIGSLGYHGGLNQAFTAGPSDVGEIRDIDLVSAYPTAMCGIKMPDYAGHYHTTDVDRFDIETLGIARVEFRFPPETKYPCLPVRADGNIFMPIRGTSTCTAPEIFLAKSMGAYLKIHHGTIIPWASDEPVFASFFAELMERRKTAPNELHAKVFKEIMNSTYGKVAQGVHPKRAFNTRRGEMADLPPSSITSSWFAAYTTGFIRAVMGEILNAVPSHRSVINVTTDGLLTTASLEEIPLSGPLVSRYTEIRRRTFDDTSSMLVVKHRAAQVVSMKTRGLFTAKHFCDQPEILAKAGLRPPVPRDQHNDYIGRLYQDREPGQPFTNDSLIGFRDQWITERDLVTVKRRFRLNLEYDFKRRPVNPREQPIGDRTHLAFDTEPWETVEHALETRVQFEAWRRGHAGVLKTLADFSRWQSFYCQRAVKLPKGSGHRSDGSFGHLKRQFCRALVRGAWGLGLGGMSYQEVVDWLSEKDISVSKYDLKNAARSASTVADRSISVSHETIPFLRVIAEQFPGLDLDAMIYPEQLQAAKAALNL